MKLIDLDADRRYLLDARYFVGTKEDISPWVPCSERMPDKNGWYLLAQAFEWGIEYEGGVWDDGAWWINDNSHVTVAWQPIEPYKEKNDE